MKHILFILLSAILSANFINTENIPEPLLNIGFNNSGIVLSGIDLPNHIGRGYSYNYTP